MLGLMFYYEVPLTTSILTLPFCLLGTLVAAVGVGTFLSALTVAFRTFVSVHSPPFKIWIDTASPATYPFEVVLNVGVYFSR